MLTYDLSIYLRLPIYLRLLTLTYAKLCSARSTYAYFTINAFPNAPNAPIKRSTENAPILCCAKSRQRADLVERLIVVYLCLPMLTYDRACAYAYLYLSLYLSFTFDRYTL